MVGPVCVVVIGGVMIIDCVHGHLDILTRFFFFLMHVAQAISVKGTAQHDMRKGQWQD